MSEFDDTAAELPFAALTDEELVEEYRELSEGETQQLFTSDDPNVLSAVYEWIEEQG